MELNDNISIEKFAAFLDGNLPENEMQAVATAIDSTKEYSDILGDAMQVDDVIDEYMNQQEVCLGSLPDKDFDLPIVPELSKPTDVVELTNIKGTTSDTVEFIKDDIHLTMALDETESTANNLCLSEAQVEHPSPCDALDMEQQTYDTNDFTDLA